MNFSGAMLPGLIDLHTRIKVMSSIGTGTIGYPTQVEVED